VSSTNGSLVIGEGIHATRDALATWAKAPTLSSDEPLCVLTLTKMWEDSLRSGDSTPFPYPDFEWHHHTKHGDETDEVPIALHVAKSQNAIVKQSIFTVTCPVESANESVVLDSAANVSLVRWDWVQDRKMAHRLKSPTKHICIKGIDGKTQIPRGVLTLDLGDSKNKTPFDFWVFDDLPVPVLLGLDILTPLHATLDVTSRKALIGKWGQVLTLSVADRDDSIAPSSEVLYLGAEYTIPPRSEQRVKIQVKATSKYNTRRAWGWSP
jgi:hypothetical protein